METKIHSKRNSLIREIQEMRNSVLLTYITGDRGGAPAQIGGDAVRPMYDHLRILGPDKLPRIDLFIYSNGGAVDVPWRMVTMLREYCEEFNVLVPFRSLSAATLIALGADHIIMGKKGELGPIDPQLFPAPGSSFQGPMSVEDIMAFIEFLRTRAGLGDQTALSNVMSILVEQLKPWTVGSIYRTHSHIRLIARKLLSSHMSPPDERSSDSIIETLAEKMYFHGHAIGRKEAKEIGLPIEFPDYELEEKMWMLFESYEELMKLRCPIDPEDLLGNDDLKEEPVMLACIESANRSDIYKSCLRVKKVRGNIPQLNMNLNLNLQLPPHIKVEEIPNESKELFNKWMQDIQKIIPLAVQEEIKKQAPIQSIEGRLVSGYWELMSDDD